MVFYLNKSKIISLLLFSLSIVIVNVILTESKIHPNQTIYILLMSFWYPCFHRLLNIWLSNLLTLSLHGEGYSINYISVF
jgi:hypothetical protein